jgi:nicotinamidase-related amidase
MQNESFAPGNPVFDKEGIILRINQLSDAFRKANNPVVLIQHDGTRQGLYIPESDEWQLISSLKRGTDDIVITKTANDSFYNSELKAVLDRNEIDTIVICGYATDFCVDTTVRSALNKNYKVKVVKDGHTTFNRSFIDAENIIRHHNIVWEYLIPTKHKVEVKTCEQVIAETGCIV